MARVHRDDLTSPAGGTRPADPTGDIGHPLSVATVMGVAVVAGVLLGVLDLFAQLTLPYPWANLANSSAVWALGAFGIGVWTGRGPVRCVGAAVVLLVVAVESYYLAAVLLLDNDPGRLISPTTLAWLVFGVIAGCVFGLAGHLRATRGTWLAALGAALPTAVLLAEAVLFAGRSDGWDHDRQTAVIEVVLAVLVAALAGRGLRGKILALLVAVPLAALGWAAFRLAGFGG